MSDAQREVPLCVDLDGTLLKTDVLWEGVLDLARRQRRYLWQLPAWVLRGKAYTKSRVSALAQLNANQLPYRQLVIDYIRDQKNKGRNIILVTAAHERAARAIADHVGLFDNVIASDDTRNVSGTTKAKILVGRFGETGFDYMGNAQADLPVWKQARRAIVVDGSSWLIAAAKRVSKQVEVIPRTQNRMLSLVRAVRPHQWVKNLLVFVPIVMAHQVTLQMVGQASIAWLALSATASALYLVNDLLDVEADRRHERKKTRPFAAGDVPMWYGLIAVPLLILIGLMSGAALSLQFIGILVLYAAGSASYSLWLKRTFGLDVLVLSALYMIRLIAGSTATGVPISRWLLLFSMFFFLSGAILKRFIEVDAAEAGAAIVRRGYTASHRQLLLLSGIASGAASIGILALYLLYSRQVTLLYHQPQLLWFMLPLFLVLLGRTWHAAAHSRMHDDPVLGVVKDPINYLVATLLALVIWLAV